jgi:glucans biosynthesis protein
MRQSVKTQHQTLPGAPRCGARARAGALCERPPISGRTRCRLHGGLSPGAPHGSKNGNYRNGAWTREALEERRWLRSLVSIFAKPECKS